MAIYKNRRLRSSSSLPSVCVQIVSNNTGKFIRITAVIAQRVTVQVKDFYPCAAAGLKIYFFNDLLDLFLFLICTTNDHTSCIRFRDNAGCIRALLHHLSAAFLNILACPLTAVLFHQQLHGQITDMLRIPLHINETDLSSRYRRRFHIQILYNFAYSF